MGGDGISQGLPGGESCRRGVTPRINSAGARKFCFVPSTNNNNPVLKPSETPPLCHSFCAYVPMHGGTGLQNEALTPRLHQLRRNSAVEHRGRFAND